MVKLSDAMRKYVEGKSKKQTKETKKTYDKRLWIYTDNARKDLQFLAEKLPESMQKEHFTADKLRPLFHALFAAEPTENLSVEKRLRMLKLCNCALEAIALHSNGPNLAPKAWSILKDTSESAMDVVHGTKIIQAIQIEAGLG